MFVYDRERIADPTVMYCPRIVAVMLSLASGTQHFEVSSIRGKKHE